MTVALFVLAGLLFLAAVTLMSDQVPFTDVWVGEWAPIVAFLSGLAGWILVGFLMWKNEPTWTLFLALGIPLAGACIVAGWHLWGETSTVTGCLDLIMAMAPLVGGLAPTVALALWSGRGGLQQAPWVAMWGAATAVVATSAIYLKRWDDPRLNLTMSDLVNMGDDENPLSKMVENAAGAEELRQAAAIQKLGAVLSFNHARQVGLRYLLAFACAVLSCLLWYLAPRFGLLGIAGGIIALVPPAIFWYRAQANRAMRMVLLGAGATVYESMFGVAVIFFVGQVVWVVKAL